MDFFNKKLFIHFWLHWVRRCAWGFSCGSWGLLSRLRYAWSSYCGNFSRCRCCLGCVVRHFSTPALERVGFSSCGSGLVAQQKWNLPRPESNLCPLHWAGGLPNHWTTREVLKLFSSTPISFFFSPPTDLHLLLTNK